MSDLLDPGHDRSLLVLSLLRRLGLGAGAFLVVYPYLNQTMRTDTALAIGLGAGLLAFCLPPVRWRRRLTVSPRGFEVVMPEQPRG